MSITSLHDATKVLYVHFPLRSSFFASLRRQARCGCRRRRNPDAESVSAYGKDENQIPPVSSACDVLGSVPHIGWTGAYILN